VGGFVSAVSRALASGEKITLAGFGTFSVGQRAQREGRNLRTGKKIEIPASKVVKFKAGKRLSSRLTRSEQNARDLEIINRRADFLNREASDVLEYQGPL
jgi:DNA-binding protein HU-beta